MHRILIFLFIMFAPPAYGQAIVVQPVDLSNLATKADNTATQASATSAANAAATAQSTANTATTNATTASTAASAAQTTANTGVTNAATAQAKANTSVQTVNSVTPTAGNIVLATPTNGEARITALELSRAVQYVTPTTGQTVVANGAGALVINPAGTLVALTITFPASPVDGQAFEILSTQVVTTMTLGGGTIASALTTIGVNGAARWKYSTSAASWLRAS